MSNMTGLGRYQKGLDLEKEGLTGAQIAAKLGYSNVQAWYDAKQYYGKKQAEFNARAAETGSKTATNLELEPVIAETPEPTPKLQQKQQFAPAAIPAEKEIPQPKGATGYDVRPSFIKSKSITLEGTLMVYRYGPDNLIHIDNRFSEDGGIVLQKSQLTEWVDELFEAVREMERIE